MIINKSHLIKSGGGFTLIELIVTIGIFAILATALLSLFGVLTTSVKAAREKTVLSSLATDYLEIVRNMPYSQVGTLFGNPHGQLADLNNAIVQRIEGFTYKIYYEVTYIDDPADGTILAGTDTAPDDYKQVKMDVLNTTTGKVTSFVTNVVPKGLEGTVNAGALLIKVFNSQGQPIAGANVHITYPTSSPTMILDRITDSTGQLIEVGLTPAVNNYRIVASQPGSSSDQTYPITSTNPNPAKPDATIINGAVTQVSFFIDSLSNLTLKTLNNICQPISNINLNVAGAKLIGTNPNVVKYNQSFGSTAGAIVLNNIEWDTYTPTLLTGQSVIVRGTSPIQKIDVLPGTSQTFTMILGTNTTANSLLVIVKDASSGAALENAMVTLHKGATDFGPFYTGGSVWAQSSWVGGAGVVNWSSSTPTTYFADDGNINNNATSNVVSLKLSSGNFAATGTLESSTFDTGTGVTNYTILSWQPTSQSASTTLAFQIAANNDNATWNYVGPDGTNTTYFTTSGTDMGSSLDNKRYVRYKAFLNTTNLTKTPVLSSININFVTGCFTPGQVIFTDLVAGAYTLDVSLPGYQPQNISLSNVNGNQPIEVLMSP